MDPGANDPVLGRAAHLPRQSLHWIIVTALTIKTDPDGNARESGVSNKFRISISEGGRDDIRVETHSACADDITNRFMSVIAPVLSAEQTSIDVGGGILSRHAADHGRGGAPVVRGGAAVAM